MEVSHHVSATIDTSWNSGWKFINGWHDPTILSPRMVGLCPPLDTYSMSVGCLGKCCGSLLGRYWDMSLAKCLWPAGGTRGKESIRIYQPATKRSVYQINTVWTKMVDVTVPKAIQWAWLKTWTENEISNQWFVICYLYSNKLSHRYGPALRRTTNVLSLFSHYQKLYQSQLS